MLASGDAPSFWTPPLGWHPVCCCQEVRWVSPNRFPHFPSADFPNGPLHFVKVISLVSWENGGGQSLAGKRVTTSSSEGAKKVTVCGLCQRLWCNCSHQGWIQACSVTDWALGRHTHMSRAPLARAAPWGPLARWTPRSSGEERSRQRNGECPPEASR